MQLTVVQSLAQVAKFVQLAFDEQDWSWEQQDAFRHLVQEVSLVDCAHTDVEPLVPTRVDVPYAPPAAVEPPVPSLSHDVEHDVLMQLEKVVNRLAPAG